MGTYALHKDLAPGQRRWRLNFADSEHIFYSRLNTIYPPKDDHPAFAFGETVTDRIINIEFPYHVFKWCYTGPPQINQLLGQLYKHLHQIDPITRLPPINTLSHTHFNGFTVSHRPVPLRDDYTIPPCMVTQEGWVPHFISEVHERLAAELSLNFAGETEWFKQCVAQLASKAGSAPTPPCISFHYSDPNNASQFIGEPWIRRPTQSKPDVAQLLIEVYEQLNHPADSTGRTVLKDLGSCTWFDRIIAMSPRCVELQFTEESGPVTLPVMADSWIVKFRAPREDERKADKEKNMKALAATCNPNKDLDEERQWKLDFARFADLLLDT
ncbi:hypothetical protein DFH06DRAFT_1128460 [Mycena polygramma]|nr:hypothetical protein DFH06DRAFT_1128460 [Mycena polygramma]